ncbi:hypothetical protein GCM10027562_28550 [Arthrobacter pigmenti]
MLDTNDLDRLEGAHTVEQYISDAYGANSPASYRPVHPISMCGTPVSGYGHGPCLRQKLIKRLKQQGQLYSYAEARFCDGLVSVRATCKAVDLSIGRLGPTAAHASMPGGNGAISNYFRICDHA